LKVSVIAWDANFRESTHTIDYFAKQIFSLTEFEFIWVDFYESNEAVRSKIANYPNCRLVTLNNDSDVKWHLGKCINGGVSEAKGELVLIPDGDIIVDPSFIEYCVAEHEKVEELILYFRRFDEPKEFASDQSRVDIDYLDKYGVLTNPTNYAACLSVKKKTFDAIGGYETHPAFAGPGINGMESYVRFRNLGACIKWSKRKIYHPWHPSSSSSADQGQIQEIPSHLLANHRWINPYGGIVQSWIVHKRQTNIDYLASIDQCELYISLIPETLREYVRDLKR
jgi:hypothetical protein